MARRKRQLSPGELISDKRPRTDMNQDQDEGKLLYAVCYCVLPEFDTNNVYPELQRPSSPAKVPQINDL
jgi:hypothetical protein